MKHYTLAWRKVIAAFLSAVLATNLAYPVVPAYAEEETTTQQETVSGQAPTQVEDPQQEEPENKEPSGDTGTSNGSQGATDVPKSAPTQGEDSTDSKQGNANDSSSLSIMSIGFDSASDGNQSGTTDDSKTSNAATQNDQATEIKVSVAVIGPDADGKDVYWLQPTYMIVKAGSTAWDAVKPALDNSGLDWNWSDSQWGISFNTITSPYTHSVLGWDSNTGKYWQLFINDAASQLGVSSATIADGDRIVYYYSGWGAEAAKNTSAAEYDEPNAEVANLPSDWSQSENNGNVTSAATPTDKTSVVWKTLVGGNSANVSEPLLVNGKVYIAVGFAWNGASGAYSGKLVRIDTATGKVEATGALAGGIDYTVRPLYENGVIYLPLKNGVVQAFNASTLKTRWVSKGTTDGAMSMCSLRLNNGILYVAGTDDWSYASGSLNALDVDTGATKWTAHTSGFYWTSPLCIGNMIYIGDTTSSGVMHIFDTTNGQEKGRLELGSRINADLVLYNGDLLVATNNGVLHRLSIGSDGLLTQKSAVPVFDKVTAAPTIIGNIAVVVGSSYANKTNSLSLVDLASMRVTRTVSIAMAADNDYGFGSPALVSMQTDGTWCYFTHNAGTYSGNKLVSGGELLAYRLGDQSFETLYSPSGEVAQFCDSPVIADAKGNLYYLNDSGYLVQLKAREVTKNDDKPSSGNTSNGTSSGNTTTATSTAKKASDTAATHHTGQRPLVSHYTNASTTSATGTSTTGAQQSDASASDQSASASDSAVTESSTSDGAAAEVVTGSKSDETATRQIPLWPIIGIICGAALLIWLFASRRRTDKKGA